MDVFPSIETSNNVLVKLVAGFNKVETTILKHSDIIENFERLPLLDNFDYYRQNVEDSFSILWAWMFIIGTPLVVSAGLINIYSMVWFTIRDWLTK